MENLNKNDKNKETQLTVQDKNNINHLGAIGTLDSQMEYATVLVKSGMLPKSYNRPETVIVALERARALKCSVVEVIYGMDFIQGKPTLSVKFMGSLVSAKGGLVQTVEDAVPLYDGPGYTFNNEKQEWEQTHTTEENKAQKHFVTDRRTTLRGTRVYFGRLVTETTSFLLSEAEAAGLAEKDNWLKWQRDMLYARCFSRLTKRFFGDMTTGMYETTEMKDVMDVEIYEDDLSSDLSID